MASAASSARHVRDHVGYLGVGLVLEEPVGSLGVELLEHVRF